MTPDSPKKDYINYNRLSEPKTGVLFTNFIEQTSLRKSKRMGDRYIANFKTLIYHIDKFCEENNVLVYVNSVNEEFMDDFIVYLESHNLKQSYIKSILMMIKSMVKKAANYGYAVDATYDDVSVDDEDTNKIYLSMNEITRIYYFQGLTKKQSDIRDLFIVGCCTALRFSDYSTLTKDDFQGKYIIKVTKKTNKKVIIPIHDYVFEIYNKHDGVISKGLTIQHFNRYLKKICKRVGLNEKITITYTKGGILTTETREKWEYISSHTARRSGATNMYLTGRLKTYEIMSLTGHKTEKSFFRYIRVTGEDTAKRIAGDSYFRK